MVYQRSLKYSSPVASCQSQIPSLVASMTRRRRSSLARRARSERADWPTGFFIWRLLATCPEPATARAHAVAECLADPLVAPGACVSALLLDPCNPFGGCLPGGVVQQRMAGARNHDHLGTPAGGRGVAARDEQQPRQALAADSRLVQGMDSSQFHGCWQQCRAVCANAAVARRGRVRLQYRRLCPQSARRTRMRRNVWVVEPCSLEMLRHR